MLTVPFDKFLSQVLIQLRMMKNTIIYISHMHVQKASKQHKPLYIHHTLSFLPQGIEQLVNVIHISLCVVIVAQTLLQKIMIVN